MKCFTALDEYGYEYELFLKTQKKEKPTRCDGCDKRIKKGMYFSTSDASDYYCLECSMK